MMMSMFAVSLFLLLLLLGAPHFQLQSSMAIEWIPVLEDGPCRDQCEAVHDFYENDNSNNGKGKDIRFRCDHHYSGNSKGALRESCIKACRSCIPEVCDEFVDENAFHCPPRQIIGKCKTRCDANRPNGQLSEYSFPCQIDSSADKRRCSECEDCAKFVCKAGVGGFQIYNCPPVHFEGVCMKRCDQNRQLGQVGGYELKCKDQKDSTACQTECNVCPDFICNKNASTLLPDIKYYCPQAQLRGLDECRELCDKFRQGSNKYEFDCKKHYSPKDCDSFCRNCPNYVCDSAQRDYIFHCPPLDPTPYFPRKKSYKGKCNERCEKSRGGGPYSFGLHCESTYISEEEKNHCLNDCNNECPEETCSGGKTILCKAQNKEAARRDREKEEEKNRTRLRREKELKDLMDTIDSKKTWIFALVMMIIFTSLAGICGVIAAWRVFDVEGDRHERPDKHTTALGRLFHRRKKDGHVVPYVPFVQQQETHASGHDTGIGPVILEE